MYHTVLSANIMPTSTL